MVVLSARFAVLACLCATLSLVLPPSVEAAHLHGSHSMGKHASSSHSHHRTRSAVPTATHAHDGKYQGHKAPDQRSPDLPPLLRRHRVHDYDYKKAHDYQSQGPHDHAHPKSPRSAFARSRQRREPGFHTRRSSVYVPGEHGNTYVISRTLPGKWGHGHAGTNKQSSHAFSRRQVDESSLVLGRIDIMGGSTQRLASLTVDSTPIDWTSGQSSAKAFPLNASTINQTQFIMMPTDEPSNAAGSLNKHVTLSTEVFDASSAEMVMYCATYDPDPGSTSALLMTPCAGTTQSAAAADDADDPCFYGNDASLSDPHESQIFSYDPSSGKIAPISATSSSSGSNYSPGDPSLCGGARVRRDSGNSTTSGSARPSSTSTSTAPATSASQQAQNVTLIYVAGSLELPPSSQRPSNSASASAGQAAFTTTITTTVVATVTASSPSNRTATAAQAAVSASTSSAPSQSATTIATPSVPITISRSSSSQSSSVSATSKAPASADESLEVEIVGVTLSTTSSASTSTTATTTTTTSSHSSVSPTLNAQAVASSIANEMPHQRRAFVSADGNVNPP
ncbi:hypothetical protein HD554DRAFT_1241838 [Boletus coccyginus]|nr:hypothetical protein HD554DRAFT_1241838 [Boletus coccyginus]